MKHSLFMLELPVPYDVRGVGGPIVFTHFIAPMYSAKNLRMSGLKVSRKQFFHLNFMSSQDGN